jgi:hypothetical protein
MSCCQVPAGEMASRVSSVVVSGDGNRTNGLQVKGSIEVIGLRPKCNPSPLGLWSKVVHYVGYMVPFGAHV